MTLSQRFHVSRTSLLASTLLASVVLLVACDRQPTPPERVTAKRTGAETFQMAPAVQSAQRGEFLPYGRPTAADQVVDRLPEPFDPIRHPVARVDEIPGVVPATGIKYPARAEFRTRSSGAALPTTALSTDAWAGIFLDSSSRGIEGLMDLRDDVVIPAGWFQALVYAPTLLPGGGSCIELTTIHWNRHDWGSQMNHGLGAWDWCHGGQFVKTAPFDQWFKDRYARIYYDEWMQPRLKYYAVVVADNPAGSPSSEDTWRVYLYNFSAGIYQQWVSLTGVGEKPNGWSMHESMRMQGYYNGGGCTTLPTIRTLAQNVLRPDGTWVPPTAAVRTSAGILGGNCFINGSYTLFLDQVTDGDWWAWTPSNSN
ncbi:MAG: hypothetical protein HYV19_04720 [Gemmatimonadetes bacterium]|nr:hypothetical protein [Gemmatimonadota bacterium]